MSQGLDVSNPGDLRHELVDRDVVGDLYKEHGLDYLKETRNLIENGLDDLGKFLEEEKSKQPDLYTDFKLLRMRANFFTFFVKVKWLHAMLEALDSDRGRTSGRTVPGLELAFKELGRHLPEIGAKYKSLKSPGQATQRRNELKGLLEDHSHANDAVIRLGRLARTMSIDFDELNSRFVMKCGEESEDQPQEPKDLMAIWKASKETARGTLPIETSLNKLSFKVPAEKDRFWSYMVDIFGNKEYDLQSKQQDLFVTVAAFARIISLSIGMAPRSTLEQIQEIVKRSSHARRLKFVDSFASQIPKVHDEQTNARTLRELLGEIVRFSRYTYVVKAKLEWMVVEEA